MTGKSDTTRAESSPEGWIESAPIEGSGLLLPGITGHDPDLDLWLEGLLGDPPRPLPPELSRRMLERIHQAIFSKNPASE